MNTLGVELHPADGPALPPMLARNPDSVISAFGDRHDDCPSGSVGRMAVFIRLDVKFEVMATAVPDVIITSLKS